MLDTRDTLRHTNRCVCGFPKTYDPSDDIDVGIRMNLRIQYAHTKSYPLNNLIGNGSARTLLRHEFRQGYIRFHTRSPTT